MEISSWKGEDGKYLSIKIKKIEIIFEIGKRGILTYYIDDENVRLFGYGIKPFFDKNIVCRKWKNDGTCCGG